MRGPINVPPSPQGEPVMVQAGASDDGRQLAAETAEVIFGAQQTLEGAQEFYADVKGRMEAVGRDPDSLKVLPGLAVCVGRTQAEAEDKYEALQELIDPLAGMQLLSRRIDFDLTGYDVDGPLPELPPNKVVSTRAQLFAEIGRRENLTIRDLYRRIAGARGHYEIVGHAGNDRRHDGGMGARARLRRLQHHAAGLPVEPGRLHRSGDTRAPAARALPHRVRGHDLEGDPRDHPPDVAVGPSAPPSSYRPEPRAAGRSGDICHARDRDTGLEDFSAPLRSGRNDVRCLFSPRRA